jgi:hypothetical protein
MTSRVLLLLAIVGLPLPAEAQYFSMGTAQNFAVLAASAVTNTGASVINGDLGLSPNTLSSITGFPPGIVVPPSTIQAANGPALQAQSDLTTSYNTLAGLPSPVANDLTGQDLGGLNLTPGVYHFDSSAQLTGALILNAEGTADARFVFQIGSTLTTASNSSVTLINGGDECNIFWQIGSSATLGTGTAFEGNILAGVSITLNTGTNIIMGRALAETGAVTLDDNEISSAGCPFVSGPAGSIGTIVPGGGTVPEPGAVALFVGIALPLTKLLVRRRLRR